MLQPNPLLLPTPPGTRQLRLFDLVWGDMKYEIMICENMKVSKYKDVKQVESARRGFSKHEIGESLAPQWPLGRTASAGVFGKLN